MPPYFPTVAAFDGATMSDVIAVTAPERPGNRESFSADAAITLAIGISKSLMTGSGFEVRPTEPPNVYWQSADGTGSPERLVESAWVNYPLAVTPDGRSLLFRQDGETTGHDLALVPLNGEKRPVQLMATEFNERNAEVSPDGRWIAYESNESGTDEVYVRPFPAVQSGLWAVSHGGGRQPLWSHDGRELFFRTPDGGVMVVPVHRPGRSGFSAGTSAAAFGAKYYVGSAGLVGRTYDVSADAKQFLMIKADDAQGGVARPSLVVVQNWVEELKQKLPIQ